MYKRIKLGKYTSISIGTFPKTAKEVSKVYCTGIHKRRSGNERSIFITIGLFRVIVHYGIPMATSCG